MSGLRMLRKTHLSKPSQQRRVTGVKEVVAKARR